MKGLLLAGGTGSRLWPITKGVSKQLLPVYDKPMVYYPLATLMLAGVREVGLITSGDQLESFRSLLGDGSHLGIEITYIEQDSPRGLADAYLVAERFLGEDSSVLVLGDNLFYGPGLGTNLRLGGIHNGAKVFGYRVSNPQDYGVVEFDGEKKPVRLIEKPTEFVSNVAVPGIYFMDSTATSRAKALTPSSRGELEITDLLNSYLLEGVLDVSILPRGTVWLDTGNFDAMAEATDYVRAVQKREGLKISAPEEIAWRLGYITDQQLSQLGVSLRKSGYGEYLLSLLENSDA
jgi:glucose-1-phosphate thymidylyltransferase